MYDNITSKIQQTFNTTMKLLIAIKYDVETNFR